MMLSFLYKPRLGIEILNKIAKMNDDQEIYGHLIERIKGVFSKDIDDSEEEGWDQKMDTDSKTESKSLKSVIDVEADADKILDEEIAKKEEDITAALDEFEAESDDNAYYEDSDEDISMAPSSKSGTNDNGEEEKGAENPLIKPMKKEVKKVMYFLNDLIYDRLDTQKLFEEGNKEKIEKEFDKRFTFRKKIKRELEMRCDLYGLNQCMAVCSKCDAILCRLKDMEMKKESLGICEIKGMLCGLSEI